MKLKKLLNSRIFLLLSIFSVFYIIYAVIFRQYSDVWWDAASYIGFGKFIFSNGANGLFEPMKPVLLPLFLGVFYKLGLSMVVFGKLLVFALSLVSLIFCYLIGKEIFDERTALLGSLILFANPLFFIFTFRIYSEILSICFILGAVLFMIKFSKKDKAGFLILSAFFAGMAFLSKYPNALVSVLLNLFLAYHCYKIRKVAPLVVFNAVLILCITPFFVVGGIIGGHPMFLCNSSQSYFAENLGHSFDLKAFPGIPRTIFETTDFVYFKTIFCLFNVILPFFFAGLWKILREKRGRDKRAWFVIAPLIMLFIFYEIFYLKQDRYIMLTFPFISLIGAYGLRNTGDMKKIGLVLGYILISMFIISSSLIGSVSEMSYWKFYTEPQINASCDKVATADARSILRYDNVIFPYEVFDENWEGGFIDKENPDCIFYFSCYSEREKQADSIVLRGYYRDYSRDTGRCLYSIFQR